MEGNGSHHSGAAYTFVRDANDHWSQRAYLKPSNTGEGDQFGYAVAIDGDTIVVGAFQEDSRAVGVDGNQVDNLASNSGAAYVFWRDANDSWTQQAYLKASNTEREDQFGYAVAISGDTIVIGAPGEDSGASGVDGTQSSNSIRASGAAYVFVRDSAGDWSQQAYLKASNPGSSDSFGRSVAIRANILFVGAPFERSNAKGVNGNGLDDSAPGAGAVYVFERDVANQWSLQAYVKASNTDAGDQFGHALAVSTDFVAIGAPREDSGSTGPTGDPNDNTAANSGAVYVFSSVNGSWTQDLYCKASNTDPGDSYGTSVAMCGDLLVVGAHLEDSDATDLDGNQADNSITSAGAAYLLQRGPDSWCQRVFVKASNSGVSDQFGYAVTADENYFAVGAPFQDVVVTGQVGEGAVYAFGPLADKCIGDLDGDADRDLADLAGLLSALGTTACDAAFVASADLDDDGQVDIADLAGFLAQLGSSCP